MLLKWSTIRYFSLLLAFAFVLADASALDFKSLRIGEYAESDVKQVTYGIYHAPVTNVSLHWQDEKGKAYGKLGVLKKALLEKGKQPVMLTNAGIFNENHQPAGLWIEHGHTLRPLNTNDGYGNFHLTPNGVFYIADNNAQIVSTEAFSQLTIQPDYAVQSGPILVINGQINKRFIADIASPYKRNGVCITDDGELYFVMSIAHESAWPNLFDFAQALQTFGCQQALYLDGSISAWYIKDVTKAFHWHTFVGIIAVTSN